jgi:hypothetical protein
LMIRLSRFDRRNPAVFNNADRGQSLQTSRLDRPIGDRCAPTAHSISNL